MVPAVLTRVLGRFIVFFNIINWFNGKKASFLVQCNTDYGIWELTLRMETSESSPDGLALRGRERQKRSPFLRATKAGQMVAISPQGGDGEEEGEGEGSEGERAEVEGEEGDRGPHQN